MQDILLFSDKRIENAVHAVTEAIFHDDTVIQATKYLTEKLRVSATVRTYKGKRQPKNHGIEILVTIARPNYRQREFIKKCKKAKVSFPIRYVQLKFQQGVSI